MTQNDHWNKRKNNHIKPPNTTDLVATNLKTSKPKSRDKIWPLLSWHNNVPSWWLLMLWWLNEPSQVQWFLPTAAGSSWLGFALCCWTWAASSACLQCPAAARTSPGLFLHRHPDCQSCRAPSTCVCFVPCFCPWVSLLLPESLLPLWCAAPCAAWSASTRGNIPVFADAAGCWEQHRCSPKGCAGQKPSWEMPISAWAVAAPEL